MRERPRGFGDLVVSVVFLREVSLSTAEVVHSDMLSQPVQVTMVGHLAMVLTVHIRVTRLSMPFHLKVRLSHHQFRAHLCLVLLVGIPVQGAPFSPHRHLLRGVASRVEIWVISRGSVPIL